MVLSVTVEVESPQNMTSTQTIIPVIFTYYAPEEDPYGRLESLPHHHYYQLDGQERVAFSASFNGSAYRTTLYGLSDGYHSLAIIVTAWEEGNLFHYKGVSPTVAFTVDTASPRVSVLTPQNQTYPSSEIPLDFTVDKPVSWVGYSIDGAATVTVSANTTLMGLAEGLHTLTVYAGNTGKSETITFNVATFPTVLVAVSTVASGVVVCFGLVAYFAKRKKKKTTE
jgi:hypothetical protein